MTRFRMNVLTLASAVGLATAPALATLPYVPAGGPYPVLGPGVAPPTVVGGKEYSHDRDESTAGLGGLPDPEQVIAWDGAGGALDGFDYTGSRPFYAREQQVDAIANHGDYLFQEVKRDTAHLIFSHDDVIYSPGAGFVPVIPSAGPVGLSNGNVIGGAGEVSIEESGAFSGFEVQHLWASDTEVNGMPTPVDVDGVEVWGPEPGTIGDADMYSLEIDIIAGAPTSGPGGPPISVFTYDSTSGMSIPYIDHPTIVAAVKTLLGPIPGGAMSQHDQPGIEAINLDALMVQDSGSNREFEPGDEIIFSINQMVDPASGAYYATGSELFVLDGSGAVSFLKHGGHTWDFSYAMTSLAIGGPDGGQGVIDINAIEAISESSVPEPATAVLAMMGLAFVAARRR